MLNTRILFCCTFLASAPSFANTPIESRGLSQTATIITPLATNTGADSVNTNINWQLIQKNQQLEADLRSLRGKIEELENANEQLNHELNNRYTDLDQRLGLLQQKLDEENEVLDEVEDNQQDKTPSLVKPIAPEPIQTAQTEIKVPQDDELDRAAYTIALEAYKQGGAAKALDPMRNFIKNHPQSLYISNAYFWMGEFYMAIKPVNYKRAQANYTAVINHYPESNKAATSLYRLYDLAKNVDKDIGLATEYAKMLKNSYPNAEETKNLNQKKDT